MLTNDDIDIEDTKYLEFHEQLSLYLILSLSVI
jgi:hypothetical protein